MISLDSAGLFASVANRLVLRESVPSLRQVLFWDRVLVPFSRWVDRLTQYSFGRTVLAVWQEGAPEPSRDTKREPMQRSHAGLGHPKPGSGE